MSRLVQNSIVVPAALLIVALPVLAHAATRYVADNGTDGPGCGVEATTACRSITQAIALTAPGDMILVGPGRYGDLNENGVLGDIAGEETGSSGCDCILSINKNVILVSSAGAAVTIIDSRSVDTIQTVLLTAGAGEFGRPGKGFMVTSTRRGASVANYGITLDAGNVMVRGNQVIGSGGGTGIVTVNNAAVRIEGNQVSNWYTGISARGSAIVSKNQVMSNAAGIGALGGTVVGNVATLNQFGISVTETATATGNAVIMNRDIGIFVSAPFNGVITRNNMFANGTLFSNCGLFNDSQANLDARNNYWGSPTGPGVAPADGVCNEGSGSTITSPFATKPFAVKVLKP